LPGPIPNPFPSDPVIVFDKVIRMNNDNIGERVERPYNKKSMNRRRHAHRGRRGERVGRRKG